MAWYEAHQTLSRHPKTLKLARLIKKDRRYTIGLLHDLFSWGLDSARKDGTLPGMTSEDIASALDFTGKAGEITVKALIESGYLEFSGGVYKIHDWYDYAGKLMDRREADKKRKRGAEIPENSAGFPQEFQRNANGNGEEIQRTDDGIPYATVPYSTVPYQDNNIHTNARARAREEGTHSDLYPDKDRFNEFWEAYPRKTGDIKQACMEYMQAVDGGADPGTLITAATELAERTAPEDFSYLPAAEKWLRNKGWLEKAPKAAAGSAKEKNQITTAAEYKPPAAAKSLAELQALVDMI